jgi:hypothetical protein
MLGIVLVLLAVVAPFVLVVVIFVALAGASLPIRNGVPGEAIIKACADTGMKNSKSSLGPGGRLYKLSLLVTPVGGVGAPYMVEIKSTIDGLGLGDCMPVIISPTNPMRVKVDHNRIPKPDHSAWQSVDDDNPPPNA